MKRLILVVALMLGVVGCELSESVLGSAIGVSTVLITNDSSLMIKVQYQANRQTSGVFELQPNTEVVSTRGCFQIADDQTGRVWIDDLSNGEGFDIDRDAAIECGPGIQIRVINGEAGGIELRLEPF